MHEAPVKVQPLRICANIVKLMHKQIKSGHLMKLETLDKKHQAAQNESAKQ